MEAKVLVLSCLTVLVASVTAAKLPTPIIPSRLPVPTSIDFVSIGSKSVTFVITVPNSVGNELHVEFTSHDGHKIQSNGIMGDSIAIKSLSGLHPGTTYTVRAFVVEGSTQGQAKVSTVTTKEDVPSGPVRGLTASSVSTRSVTVKWKAPETQHINSIGGITGYYVELRRFERNRCEGKVLGKSTTNRKATFDSLIPDTSYCVIVFPENRAGRARELHASGGKTTFRTQQDAPSDSPTLRLVQPQFTQLTLAWDEPSQPNGQLTQYVIQYRQGSGRWMESTVSASAKYKLFTSGFDSGSRYQVRIAAVNSVGRGNFSTPVQFTMQPPVYDIGVCRLSSTSAKFVWKLRSRPSMGGELTQLRFTLSSSGQREEYSVNKTSSGIVRGGLMNKEYRLSVVLVWSEGDRLYFQPDSKDLGTFKKELNCFPSLPRRLKAEPGFVHPNNFTVTWSEPSTANGQIFKYITIVRSVDGVFPYNNTFEGMSTRLTVSGLEEAVQYTVKVRAVNQFEEGPDKVLSVTTKDSAPSGPARNISVERISTTAVEVTWEDPAPVHINAVGGIIGYRVVIGSRDCRGESKKPKNTTNLKVVFGGLKPGTVHCVRVFPLNNIGAAPDDIVRGSAVIVELPDVLPAPKPIGQTVSSTHVVITWQKVESTDEENPVTNYIINNSSSNEPITLPPDSEYYNVTGLSPGREYTVKVAAKNAMGLGRSVDYIFNTTDVNELHITPNKTRNGVPGVPVRNIKVQSIGNTAVEVTWEDPVVEQTTLGGGITGYRVVIGNRKCTTELQTWTVQDNVNTVKFGSLEPGGRYCVRIYPFNNDGPAPESIVKDSAVTTKLPDLLDAPKLVGTALGDCAALLWSEVVAKDEENPVINYIVYPSDGSLPIILPPTARHHNMVNLTKGETYTVKVAAKSGLGEGRKATFTFST